MLKILVVSFRFPPYNSMGAISVGQTVKYLARRGHDIRVITADKQPLARDLPVEPPDLPVTATRWLDLLAWARAASGGSEAVAARGYSGYGTTGWRRRGTTVVRSLLLVPDGQIGWYPFAVRAGAHEVRSWRPDIVLASGPPFSSLIVGRAIAKRHRVPWVAYLRDLWSDNPHQDYSAARRLVDHWLERRTLSSAAGLVSTTPRGAAVLRERYGCKVVDYLNGFDEETIPNLVDAASPGPLRVVHTGVLNHGRNIGGVLRAIERLYGQGLPVVLELYGRYGALVNEYPEAARVREHIRDHGQVDHGEALRHQATADVLLLVQRLNDQEAMTYPGKLFEYAASGRPVLAVTPEDSATRALIQERGLGCVASTDHEIESALRSWAIEKQAAGSVRPVVNGATGLDRATQVERLDMFLADVFSTSTS